MDAFFGTFLNHWPLVVSALSMPSKYQVLGTEDVRALLSQHPETRALIGCASRLRFSETLVKWMDRTVELFSDGAFARLGACSFVTPERGPKKVCTGEQVLKLMMHPGIRAASLAYRCFLAGQPIALYIREWRDIPPWSEFRVFINNRKVLGISQYHWRCTFPQIEDRVEGMVDTIYQAATCIAATAHLKSVVADLYLAGPDSDASWVLIELNPYFAATSGCLFNWGAREGLDCTFRYRALNNEVRAIPLTI